MCMPKLPVISGEKAVKAFVKAGWKVDRIVGSHVILRKEGSPVTLSHSTGNSKKVC